MSEYQPAHKTTDSLPVELSPEALEQQRIDTVLDAFDQDRRDALRILSGRVLAALHDVRLSRDETIPEAEKNRLTGALAELTAAAERLLNYEQAGAGSLEQATVVAA